MKNIPDILRSFGLLDSEVKVYLSALELGPSTVIDIADATKLSRPATYTAINALTERGLMSTVTRGKKRLFTAEHPDRVLQYAKRKEHEIGERISDLERQLSSLALRMGGERPVVKSYEGKEGIYAIIEDVRETRPPTLEEITNVDAMRTVLGPEDLAPMRDELKRIGTKVRGLYTGAQTKPTDITSARMLPDELSNFKGNITIYGSKIALVTFSGKFHSVIVQDEVLAGTLRALFEVAWIGAKDFTEKK